MERFSELDHQAVTALRVLAIDQVEQAASGHPGLPLGAAPMAYVLASRFLRFDPQAPDWPNRDRFVLSAGHGSALLYALLHLLGYDLPLEELRRFRQWGSRTPGHPEHGLTPGVETTSGPLGQGLATAVGMAVAERHLAARFNREQFLVVDHRTFVLASDGDLMEGISHEAAALAGHWRLGKLVVLWDDNRITIEGPSSLAWSEDVEARFAAYGFLTLSVEDGNDLEAIAAALEKATSQTERPVLIRVRTHIGYGSPHKQDTAEVHGAPLGPEEHRATRRNLGWPHEEPFFVPEPLREHFRQKARERARARQQWLALWARYREAYPELAQELARRLAGELPSGWDRELPVFGQEKPLATREASGKVLNVLAGRLPELLGGSADLAPSNNTLLAGEPSFQAATPAGRNLHFGVREHAMAAIANGLSLHGGVRPYVATFLVFADYLRPALRLAALMEQPVVYVFTHDSIGLGEDGPTHQPVEHLPALRAIPNLRVLRPADANETTVCWRLALARREGPTALVLTRQKLPVLPPQDPALVERGAYVLEEASGGVPEVVLWATGSEVHLALAVRKLLEAKNIATRVVSAPCLELFEEQPDSYRAAVRGPSWALAVALEAARGVSFRALLGDEALVFSLERFGASAPGPTLFRELGFDPEAVASAVERALAARRPAPPVWHPDRSGEVAALVEKLATEALPRLVSRDATLWGQQHAASVARRLGFLDLPHRTLGELPGLERLVAAWAGEGAEELYLLGMGGSSLAPQVLASMLQGSGGRKLVVVDTTDPVTVGTLLEQLNPERAAVLAVSKSGTTVETTSLLALFWERLAAALPHASRRFAVLTEPGTPLWEQARERGFAAAVPHPVDVGGRFAALGAVGMLPALWLGLPAEEILQQAIRTLALGPHHPALELAAGIATRCEAGWGRLLLFPDAAWRPFAPWLEQLLAESTGKEGKGVLPIVPETPEGLQGLPDTLPVALGEHATLPLPGLQLALPAQRLGEAFALWELATALLGFLLGVNPFDEPDVAQAKARAKAALARGVASPPLTPEAARALAAHLAAVGPRQAVVLLSFLPETPAVASLMAQLAAGLQRKLGTTVAWAFGPRYLHSTGQLHKGGPATVVPVVLTAQQAPALPIPGQSHTLGELRLAQALGDVEALAAAGRRVLHLHLPGDGTEALAQLAASSITN
jgi:transketolase